MSAVYGVSWRSNMLTRQLRELEADGLITRRVYRQVPPRVEYALTEPGLGLFPILVSMRDWGAGYEKAMGAAPTPAGEAYDADRTPSLHPRYKKQDGLAASPAE